MGGFNIADVLKIGLPGLVFLLAALSYRLLLELIRMDCPDPIKLDAVKSFAHVNVVLAVLTLAPPLMEHYFSGERIEQKQKNENLERRLDEYVVNLKEPLKEDYNKDAKLLGQSHTPQVGVRGYYKYDNVVHGPLIMVKPL